MRDRVYSYGFARLAGSGRAGRGRATRQVLPRCGAGRELACRVVCRRVSTCRGARESRGLAHLDEVAVRVTHVAAQLVAPVCRWGQELGAACGPLLIDTFDVRDADVQKAADAIRVGRRLESHCRLVVSGWSADV